MFRNMFVIAIIAAILSVSAGLILGYKIYKEVYSIDNEVFAIEAK